MVITDHLVGCMEFAATHKESIRTDLTLAELFTEIVPQWIFSTTQPDHITIEPDYGVTVKCLQGRLSICCSEVLILDCLDFEVSLPNVFMLL
jgi:hypothetical protein